jgi:hypothetical protein
MPTLVNASSTARACWLGLVALMPTGTKTAFGYPRHGSHAADADAEGAVGLELELGGVKGHPACGCNAHGSSRSN